MEYGNKLLPIVGILGLLFWSFNFFYFYKKPELYLPKNFLVKKLRISRFFVFIIGFIGWLLISYSFSNPKEKGKMIFLPKKVNDIFFVVDISRSMLANDFKPNRIEVAKKKILKFINYNPQDRLGLILFSEKVYTLSPLTTDLKLLKKMVQKIKVGFLGSGTNIGDAIALAVGRSIQSVAKNKFLILLTDGVSNVGSLTVLEAAKIARRNKIKIYTIGIGTDDKALIPTGDNFLYSGGFQKIPGGSIDFKTLKLISKLTSGKSYLATNEKALEEILNKINKIEKTKIEVNKQYVSIYRYFPYLFCGVVLLFFSEIIRRFWFKEAL
tara:strand:- start:3188 stop:4162 length:975 start_codon:yes stop_codon:yes gene_type:complete